MRYIKTIITGLNETLNTGSTHDTKVNNFNASIRVIEMHTLVIQNVDNNGLGRLHHGSIVTVIQYTLDEETK